MRNIVLFDDPVIRQQLYPFSLTRPIGAFRAGITTLAEKWEYYLKGEASYLSAVYLQEKFPLKTGKDNLFIASHLLPSPALAGALENLAFGEALWKENDLLAFHGDDFQESREARRLDYPEELHGISYPFHLFAYNGMLLEQDFAWLTRLRTSRPLSSTNQVSGKENIFIEEGARVECSMLIADEGPIYIGKHALVMEGSMIRGPFAMCGNAVVKMGAKIYGATTLGPGSTGGGEIKNSIFFGYSNKAHDGYLGDAVIGEWCNLGANTNCSNLKNNAGIVQVWDEYSKSFVPAGTKCGLLMGDYSRSGISTMFNTGTVTGVSCNIFGGEFPPKHIPSFSWGGAAGWMKYEADRAIKDARAWMALKGKTMTAGEEAILKELSEKGGM